MDKDALYQYIEDFYKGQGFGMPVTKRICMGLAKVAMMMFSENSMVPVGKQDEINNFLLAERTQEFIKERQPQISPVPDEIIDMVKRYFQKNLTMYGSLEVFRSSNHLEDDYLFSIIGFHNNGTFSCWTSFNSQTESLNNGHYGLKTENEALEIISSYYHDITGEPEKYGILESRREISDIKQLGRKAGQNRDISNVIPFRPRRVR